MALLKVICWALIFTTYIINQRISTLSSDKQTFQDAAPAYQNALQQSNFGHMLEYMLHATCYMLHATQQSHRQRQRKIIWFKAPAV